MSGEIYCVGRKAVVSHSPESSRTAFQVFERGGNAVDAAVTASLLLNVFEPGWSGVGGGGFLLLYSDEVGLKALDYRETAPHLVKTEKYAGEQDLSMGYRAVAVPGTLKGLWTVHRGLGKLEWRQIIDIVVKKAREARFSRLWNTCMINNLDDAVRKVSICPESVETFLKNGRPHQLDSRAPFEKLATTLEKMKDDVDDFYRGGFAEKIEEVFTSNGGFLSADDLSGYDVVWRSPVVDEIEVGGRRLRLAAMPPPGSGVLVVEALKILSRKSALQDDYFLLLGRVLRHVIHERLSAMADPDFSGVKVDEFLSEEHIRKFFCSSIGSGGFFREDSGTSHITVVDEEERTYVSLTETIECFMGSGVTVDGVLLNDEMHDFALQPGHVNAIAPGKRPASSMSPLIVFEDERPVAVLGASGGTRIISSIVQCLSNFFLQGLDPVSSVLEGRVHVIDGEVVVEESILDKVCEVYRNAGLRCVRGRELSLFPGTDIYFGAVQGVFRRNDSFLAVSDPRKQPGAYAK